MQKHVMFPHDSAHDVHVMFPHSEHSEYTQQVVEAFGKRLLAEAYEYFLKKKNWLPFKYLDSQLDQKAVAWLEKMEFVKRLGEFDLQNITFPIYEITQKGIDYIFIEKL